MRTELNEKRKRKVRFLKQKYGQSKRIPDDLEGINIADKEIPTTFTSEPRCYGGISLTENEKKVLNLPPKFAVYGKVDSLECEAEIEKGLAKLRWRKKRASSKGDEGEYNGVGKGLYDYQDGFFNFCYMKATDLPFNRRVYLPSPLDTETEISIQNLKVGLNRVVRKYVENERSAKWRNLDHDEKEGLTSLRRKVRSQECIIFQTDKSGRFSLDTVENYKLVFETHVAEGVVISEEDYVRLQRLVNAHAVFWTRFLQAGSKTKSATKLKDSMVSVGSSIAPLYTLRKDHKVYDDESRGPPVRPVCGARGGWV